MCLDGDILSLHSNVDSDVEATLKRKPFLGLSFMLPKLLVPNSLHHIAHLTAAVVCFAFCPPSLSECEFLQNKDNI